MVEQFTPFCDAIINAMPECVCLYKLDDDELIPNNHWKHEVGDGSRLADLHRLEIDVSALAGQIRSGTVSPEGFDCSIHSDALGMRRLVITEVAGYKGIYLFYLRDETEVRRVEQLRKDFIANVSHELRTPLTAVKGYVETLLDPKFLTIERVREFLPIIFEHTERLHNIMLDLLSLSRLESPNTHIELSPLALGEQLHEAVDATAPLARMKNLQVNLDMPPDSLQVLANAEHMERILVNLLDNAIKYSSPNGRVDIWTEVTDNFIWTHVRDQGTGIAAEELGRVFERFYRTRGALSGRARGSGLGLAIVKHIVQQLGGEINVASELGKGSDFSFSLQRALARETVID